MGRNFGDTINPLFISSLTGKEVIQINPQLVSVPYVSAIGSIVEHISKNGIIWGSGFISEESKLKVLPYRVLAVRGPRSRRKMLEHGVECPEVYGDPALLLPRLYAPKVQKKFSLGVIPHIFDKDNNWLKETCVNNPNIKIIDLEQENVWAVIDDILSCEKVASSSLHGIITADAYQIPSVWIEFSDKVIGKGFKFLDYFESVGRKDTEAYRVESTSTLEDIQALFYDYSISIDLDLLLEAAPFKVKKELLASGKDE